jgi:hypothetical protein
MLKPTLWNIYKEANTIINYTYYVNYNIHNPYIPCSPKPAAPPNCDVNALRTQLQSYCNKNYTPSLSSNISGETNLE